MFTLVGPGRLAGRKEQFCSQFLYERLKAVISWTSVDALHCITKFKSGEVSRMRCLRDTSVTQHFSSKN